MQNTSRKFNPEALRIRAHLGSNVVINDPCLPFDSLLYSVGIRGLLKDSPHTTLPAESTLPKSIDYELPILKRNENQDSWYYAASFADYPRDVVVGKTFYTSSFKVDKSLGRLSKTTTIYNQSGKFKSIHNTLYYLSCRHIDWYVTGDKTQIQELLMHLTAIGKKVSQGFGQVKEWEVIEWSEEWYLRRDRKVMRSIPVNQPEKHSHVKIWGVRPSYWLPKHQFPCLVPRYRFLENVS